MISQNKTRLIIELQSCHTYQNNAYMQLIYNIISQKSNICCSLPLELGRACKNMIHLNSKLKKIIVLSFFFKEFVMTRLGSDDQYALTTNTEAIIHQSPRL